MVLQVQSAPSSPFALWQLVAIVSPSIHRKMKEKLNWICIRWSVVCTTIQPPIKILYRAHHTVADNAVFNRSLGNVFIIRLVFLVFVLFSRIRSMSAMGYGTRCPSTVEWLNEPGVFSASANTLASIIRRWMPPFECGTKEAFAWVTHIFLFSQSPG